MPALDIAWEFLKAVRTSAHPLGARGSYGRQVAEDPKWPDTTTPTLFCRDCGEEYGAGEKCVCERARDSAGVKRPMSRNARWEDTQNNPGPVSHQANRVQNEQAPYVGGRGGAFKYNPIDEDDFRGVDRTFPIDAAWNIRGR